VDKTKDFVDRTLVCKDCKVDFVFTSGEQRFYSEKGFENEPGRCPDCRLARKRKGSKKELHSTTCAQCGVETQVPFEPKEGRPVYCRECYKEHAKKAG